MNKKKVKLNRDIEKPQPEKEKPVDTIKPPIKSQPKFTGIDIGLKKSIFG